MTVVRPQGEISAAGNPAQKNSSTQRPNLARRWAANGIGILGALVMLAIASNASALIITSQGTNLPGGGSCSIGGITTTGTGATFNCTGIVLTGHTNVYLGIRNTVSPNGNTMTGADPVAGPGSVVFRSSGTTVSSISYTSATSVNSEFLGSTAVTNTLTLTRTAGTGTVVATGGTPASNNNGDIANLFKITAAGTFTLDVDVAANASGIGSGQACPAVYDPAHVNLAAGDHSRVDLQFYWSDCGDGALDSPEQCDDGVNNGTLGSCCTTTCTFKLSGTACTDDGNPCRDDQCNGASAICQHPVNSAPCSDAVFCNGTDTCSGGTCSIHAGNPCLPLNTTDSNCSASCNEGADNCTAPDPNGTGCSDGLFCNGTDTCSSGACTVHSGDPCSGPDGDTNCSETCNEGADNCTAPDPDGSTCRPGVGLCDVTETCSSGVCPPDGVQPASTVCNAGSGDSCDPDEVCDGISAACPSDTITPSGTTCRTGSGDSCDPDETCTGVANAPCPPDVVASNGTVCNAGSGDECDPDETCSGTAGQPCPSDVVEPASHVCRAGSGDSCDPDETCPGVANQACPSDTFEPNTTVCRTGSGDMCDPDETCPGVPTGTCAAQVVAPPTTICRNAVDLCDAAELCTGTAGQTCPSDSKQPASTPCRAAVHSCDVAEVCDGVSNTCPPDALKNDGDSCEDGQFCNGAETCQGGSCTDGTDPCSLAAICNEGTDQCQTTVCPNTPQTCRTAGKSLLIIKNKDDNNKDKIIWKYIRGEATTQGDFADPTTSADYALCIYAGPTQALKGTVYVAPGSNWHIVGTNGYKYLDPSYSSDGTQKVLVKGTGAPGKTKAILKSRGIGAPDPLDMGPLVDPVVAQLYNYGTGACWQGTYTTAVKSTGSLYKGKQ